MSIRDELIKYAKMCSTNGLTIGTLGNVSAREGDVMYITPSALPYDEMTVEDVIEIDLNSRKVVSGYRKPSSETPMHSFIYQKKPSIKAIVHTHSSYATIFACAHMTIPPVHYLIADIGKEVPVAKYATYGSELLANYAVEALGEGNGVLLANHGVVAIGSTLKDAYRRAERIEEVAKLAYGSYTLQSVKPLTQVDLEDALRGYVSGQK